MRIKRILTVLSAILLLFSVTFLSGCMDTGDFESDAAYYDAFGEIALFDQVGVKTVYSLEDDFYNEDTMVHMTSSVPDDKYVFFCVEILRQMRLEELYLYVRGQVSATLSLSFFVLSADPAVPMALDAPIPEEDPTDPLFSPIAEQRLAINYNAWTSFFASSLGVAGADGVKRLYPGDILCIRFNNNTCYGQAAGLTPVELTLTNFIVRIQN